VRSNVIVLRAFVPCHGGVSVLVVGSVARPCVRFVGMLCVREYEPNRVIGVDSMSGRVVGAFTNCLAALPLAASVAAPVVAPSSTVALVVVVVVVASVSPSAVPPLAESLLSLSLLRRLSVLLRCLRVVLGVVVAVASVVSGVPVSLEGRWLVSSSWLCRLSELMFCRPVVVVAGLVTSLSSLVKSSSF
jgi:hypothetical protein